MLTTPSVAEQFQFVSGPAAGLATATVVGGGDGGMAALTSGACCAWPLPREATCARAARRIFRQAARSLGIADDRTDDGVTMASELAANTLHALGCAETGGDQPAGAELWLYVRHVAGQWELVCKVFDPLRGWKTDLPPEPAGAGPDAVGGRGLQVVAGLSAGRWGHHLTRSRLGGWKVPGKAVWFAIPVPTATLRAPDWAVRSRTGPCQAARQLAVMLADRGLGERLVVTDEPAARMAVLSVRCGLTIWCRDHTICWRTRAGRYQQQPVTELVDSAEQIISTCEEIDRGVGAGYLGLDRVR